MMMKTAIILAMSQHMKKRLKKDIILWICKFESNVFEVTKN